MIGFDVLSLPSAVDDNYKTTVNDLNMNNLKILMVALCLLGVIFSAQAQSVGINADNSTPNSSAMPDVKATNKDLLIPNVAIARTTNASSVNVLITIQTK